MSDTDSGTIGTVDGSGSEIGNLDGFTVYDPDSGKPAGSGSGSNDGGDTPRRRGRKPGSKNASTKDTANLTGVDIKDILLSIHTMLAIRMSCPEMELTDDEAARMDKAVKRVMRHYPLNVSQKAVDTSMLFYVLADVYGTRAVAFYMKSKVEKEAENPAGNVAPFRFPNGA